MKRPTLKKSTALRSIFPLPLIFFASLAGCGGGDIAPASQSSNVSTSTQQAVPGDLANPGGLAAQPLIASAPARPSPLPSPTSSAAKALRKLWEDPDLPGSDVNGDGIRDDVTEFMKFYQFKPVEKKAFENYARSINKIFLRTDYSENEIKQIGDEILLQVTCLVYISPDEPQRFASIQNDIFAKTVSTKKRILAFEEFQNRYVKVQKWRNIDGSKECLL